MVNIFVCALPSKAASPANQPVPFFPIYPSSDTAFFYKVVAAHMDFAVTPQGQVTGIEFYQNGHHISAPRIDAAKAQQIQSALEKRVSAQQPYPDSEQILQIVLSGNEDSPRLSPELAKLMREQHSAIEAMSSKLGPITSHEFVGVNPQGWDGGVNLEVHRQFDPPNHAVPVLA